MANYKPTERQQKLLDEITNITESAIQIFGEHRDARISSEYDRKTHKNIPYDKSGLPILTKSLEQKYLELLNSETAREEPLLFRIWMRHSIDKLKRLTDSTPEIKTRITEVIGLQEIYDYYELNKGEYIKCILNTLEKINTPDERPLDKDDPIPTIEFENVSQKLLFLDALGILDSLSEHAGFDIQSKQMGAIVAHIINENASTVTRVLRFFIPHQKAVIDKNNPFTPANLKLLFTTLNQLKIGHLRLDYELKVDVVKPK